MDNFLGRLYIIDCQLNWSIEVRRPTVQLEMNLQNASMMTLDIDSGVFREELQHVDNFINIAEVR